MGEREVRTMIDWNEVARFYFLCAKEDIRVAVAAAAWGMRDSFRRLALLNLKRALANRERARAV
jgi:hypothetical protein